MRPADAPLSIATGSQTLPATFKRAGYATGLVGKWHLGLGEKESGIDWDGEVTFQLDSADKAREQAQRLLAEGKAYEDEGAIRFRQPEGSVAWDDAVRGRIAFQT